MKWWKIKPWSSGNHSLKGEHVAVPVLSFSLHVVHSFSLIFLVVSLLFSLCFTHFKMILLQSCLISSIQQCGSVFPLIALFIPYFLPIFVSSNELVWLTYNVHLFIEFLGGERTDEKFILNLCAYSSEYKVSITFFGNREVQNITMFSNAGDHRIHWECIKGLWPGSDREKLEILGFSEFSQWSGNLMQYHGAHGSEQYVIDFTWVGSFLKSYKINRKCLSLEFWILSRFSNNFYPIATR